MNWAAPQYSKTQVNRAGEALVNYSNAGAQELLDALSVVDNWRASHSFPLNTFQSRLRKRAKDVDDRSLVAQRLKRLTSIQLKLSLHPAMKLSQMQDIGGCRVVLSSVPKVRQLVGAYQDSGFKHDLRSQDDYIKTPKASGYRSIHLIYRYHSDRKQTYNGLQIEMQFRSQLQHAWATAVETVGTFLKQALKSSQGERDWLRFFALMGTAIAGRERTEPVPNTPFNARELVQEIEHWANALDVERRLRTYGATIQTFEFASSRNDYYLLVLDPGAGNVTVTGFDVNEMKKATDAYMVAEERIRGRLGAEAVLVSVDSLAALKRAYPNYFLDTRMFIDAVTKARRSPVGRRRPDNLWLPF